MAKLRYKQGVLNAGRERGGHGDQAVPHATLHETDVMLPCPLPHLTRP